MSEDEAWRRVTASRLHGDFQLYSHARAGRLHLTALLLLREHLTTDKPRGLLRAAQARPRAGPGSAGHAFRVPTVHH